MEIKRNTIIWVDLGENKGHIQSGQRPCIVVSCDKANKHAPVYTVIPGTTKYDKKNLPVHFELYPEDVRGFLRKKTIFLAEQLCTIDEKQIICKAGEITNEDVITQMNKILVRQLGMDEGK